MNAKSELAGRIMMLVCDEVQPNSQRILDILKDYKIEYSADMDEADFNRAINNFLGAKRAEGLADRSQENYLLYLKMFGDYLNKRIGEISSNDIRDFIMYLGETRRLKNSSIQTVINTLRSFFSWLHAEELISKNPMVRIKSYTINKKDARHPLTQEELEQLRDACRDYREKAIVEFLYSTGCRLSEAVQINYSDLNMVHRCVDVIGKGSKRRTLYFSVRAKLMIMTYQKERKGGTALFCSCRQPCGRLQGPAIERVLRELGKRAGIARRIHPHILRHTFATHMLNAGMDISIIQQLLGHSSIGTTEIYAEISQDSVRREYDKFVA